MEKALDGDNQFIPSFNSSSGKRNNLFGNFFWFRAMNFTIHFLPTQSFLKRLGLHFMWLPDSTHLIHNSYPPHEQWKTHVSEMASTCEILWRSWFALCVLNWNEREGGRMSEVKLKEYTLWFLAYTLLHCVQTSIRYQISPNTTQESMTIQVR